MGYYFVLHYVTYLFHMGVGVIGAVYIFIGELAEKLGCEMGWLYVFGGLQIEDLEVE